MTWARLATRLGGFFLLLSVGVAFADSCIDMPLKPVRHVCGIVSNQIDERIPNAKLTLLKDGMELTTIQSDSKGKFEFGRLEAGRYELRVEFDGYHTIRSPIVIVRPTTHCDRELEVRLPLLTCGGGVSRARR